MIIPVINLWKKYTKPCLDSVLKCTEGLIYPYRVLLIDNGSSDETREEMTKYIGTLVGYMRFEQPNSFSQSVNIGIRDGIQRGFTHFLVLNNDVLLNKNTVSDLLKRFINSSETENLAIATPLNIKDQTTPEGTYEFSTETKTECIERESPDFSAFMISREAFERVGEFDEGFEKAYHEDNDYHYRIRLLGMKAICLLTAYYYHFGSRTQNEACSTPIVTGSQFEKNRNYYIAKWGGDHDGNRETFKQPFNDSEKDVTWTKQRDNQSN